MSASSGELGISLLQWVDMVWFTISNTACAAHILEHDVPCVHGSAVITSLKTWKRVESMWSMVGA
jgi:hypothetical protein